MSNPALWGQTLNCGDRPRESPILQQFRGACPLNSIVMGGAGQDLEGSAGQHDVVGGNGGRIGVNARRRAGFRIEYRRAILKRRVRRHGDDGRCRKVGGAGHADDAA